MTLVLDAAAVQAGFKWDEAISALRDAYAGEMEEHRFPPRAMARGDHGWMRTMTGSPAGAEMMGLKVISVSTTARGGGILIALFKQRTGEFAAMMNGRPVTGYRTAATSALAADLLAPAGPVTVGVLGSGFEAKNHLRALAAVRDITSAKVYSPTAENRASFATELADLGVPITPVDTPASAVDDVSLIICAARSHDESPILLGDWLRPGMTVISIGSTIQEQREVDTDVVARSDVIIADVVDEIMEETGDMLAARDAGVDVGDRIASLADLVGGRHPGRTDASQIVMYKSVGSALQDLAVASLCLRNAERLGLGFEVPNFLAFHG